MNKNVISVIDGEAGSCGKAKVIGEIATLEDINLGASVTNCMPNAGHSFVDEKGKKTVFRNIPVSSVNPKTKLFIGPGSAIDMKTFKEEYENVKHLLNGRKIYVHEMVPLIEERHKEKERENIKSGSTFKGCGAVSQEKIIIDKNLEFFKTYKDAIVCKNDEWQERLYTHLDNNNEYVILEGAQGCDLDLNHSGNYPFVRISNITENKEFIYTGAYGNGEELTWSQINISSLFGWYPSKELIEIFKTDDDISNYIKEDLNRCPEVYLKQIFGENYKNITEKDVDINQALELERLFYKSIGEKEYESVYIDLPLREDKDFPTMIRDLSEETTVTKKERRIFDLDINKLKNNCRINTPSSLYLNFFQHLNYDFNALTGNYEDIYFDKTLRTYIDWLESSTNTEVSTLGTGERNGQKIKKKELIKRKN